jgi:hypothetical protein
MSRLLTLILACAIGVAHADPDEPRPAPPTPLPEPVEAPALQQVTSGDSLFSSGMFREAAAQYEAAYAIDPRPEILERLANAYDMAGDRARAQLLRHRLHETVQPAPPFVQPAPPTMVVRPQVAPGAALLRTGLGMFAGAYSASLVSGAIALSVTDSTVDPNYYHASSMLFVPVLGPFISCHWATDPLWVAPMVINGLLQTTGVALAIAGGVIMRSHKKPALVVVTPFSTSTTQGLAVGGTF